MPAQRFYVYRCGATNAWALTGEKGDPRLPAPLATDQWRFWMQISCHQIENGVFAFALKTVATQVAAKGYYLFTHSITPRDARAGPDAGSSGGHRTSVGTTAVMSKAHQLFSSASYDPDTLNMLGEVLDEAWVSIASYFGNDFCEIEVRAHSTCNDCARPRARRSARSVPNHSNGCPAHAREARDRPATLLTDTSRHRHTE